MRKLLLLYVLLAALPVAGQPMRLMAWNVENMFHPSDDAATEDDAFTPNGEYQWTYSRFMRKANLIAQTIAAAEIPSLVALCEIEDDSTMIGLTRFSVMRTVGYRWLRAHGNDRRGINVALMYDPFRFRPVQVREVEVPSAELGCRPTRNLLYVAGEVKSERRLDTLHVVVCHLPSQAGDVRTADRHRRLAASVLRGVVDSVTTASPEAAIIVAGDFNSDSNSSILRSLCDSVLRALPSDFEGTYRFRGDWTHLDHVLCTSRVDATEAHVLREEFLLEPNATYGGVQPRRTFRGPSYHGGISDHLPVCVDIRLKNKKGGR